MQILALEMKKVTCIGMYEYSIRYLLFGTILQFLPAGTIQYSVENLLPNKNSSWISLKVKKKSLFGAQKSLKKGNVGVGS